MLNLPITTGGVPDPYVPPDGTWNVTGSITASGTISAAAFTATGFTQGSVIFAGASGAFTEDNANLFWDDTNNQLVMGAGTVTAPSVTFAGDQNTGVYWVGADSFALTAGGAAKVTVATTGTTLTQAVSTSGSPTLLAVTAAAHTTLAASTEATDVNFNLARTVQFATGALATQRAMFIQAPTYGFVGASTITTAATLYIDSAPVAGTNATISNRYAAYMGGTLKVEFNPASGYPAIWLNNTTGGGNNMRILFTNSTVGQATTDGAFIDLDTANLNIKCQDALGIIFATSNLNRWTVNSSGHLLGSADNSYDIGQSGLGRPANIYAYTAMHTADGTALLPGFRFVDDPNTGIYRGGTDILAFSTGGVLRASIDATGDWSLTQGAGGAGTSPTGFTFTGAAHLNLATTVEATDVNFNLARSVQFAAGTLAVQRAMRIQAPTYAFVTSSTLTTATTLDISGAPTQGTNANIVQSYALAIGAAVTLTSAAGNAVSAVYINGYTVTLTGTTQVTSVNAAVAVNSTTYTDASAVTMDAVASVNIEPPTAAGSVTMTEVSGYRALGSGSFATHAAGFNYASVRAAAGTITFTGTTPITAAPGVAGVYIGQITATNTSALTIDTAASLYVAGPPIAGGSVTITSLWTGYLGGAVLVTGTPIDTNMLLTVRSNTANAVMRIQTTASGSLASDGLEIGAIDVNARVLNRDAGSLSLGTTANNRCVISAGGTWTHTMSAQTSGAHTMFTLTGAANTGQTASTEVMDAYWNLGRTVQFATGALTTQRAFVIAAPTYGFVGASTLTTAATLDVNGPPTAGTFATITVSSAAQIAGTASLATVAGLVSSAVRIPSYTLTLTGTTQVTSTGPAGIYVGAITVTNAGAGTVDTAAAVYIAAAPVAADLAVITNSYAIWVDAGTSRFDGVVYVSDGSAAAPAIAWQNDTNTGFYVTNGSSELSVAVNGSERGRFITAGFLSPGVTYGSTYQSLQASDRITTQSAAGYTWTQNANATGTNSTFLVTAGAHTNLTASTEVTDINFNLARTVEFATGALTTQRAFRIQAPTYGFVGASTLTTAATVAISGGPTQGANATITQSVALYLEGGAVTLASAAAAQAPTIFCASRTVTFTGTTQITNTANGQIFLQSITYTDASSVTMDVAATFSLAAPIGAGSVAITRACGMRMSENVSYATHAAGFLYNGILIANHTVTFTATTQITSTAQAAISVGQITLTNAGGHTIDNAASVYIAGPFVAGGSAVITNNYALWVDSGIVRWDDPIAMGGGAAATLGTIGGSGPAAAAQNQWLRVNVNGTANYIPVWQ